MRQKSHIWFYLEVGPFSLLQTTSLLCIFFDFTDKGHRRTLDSQDKRKPHCLLSQFMWRRFLFAMLQLEYLTEAQINMTRHQRWLTAGVQMLSFKGKCHRIQFFMLVWRLTLVWQEQSINLAWRPRKTVFWNFVKVKSLTAGFIQHLIKEQAQIVVRTVEVQTVLDNSCTVFIFRVTAGSKRLWEQSAQILLHVYYVFHKQARRIVALNTTIR